MNRTLFPSDIVVTINRPLDGKANVLTVGERDAIPVTQRYRGMVLVVQNPGDARSRIFWLPTDNLTNTGWEELGDEGDAAVLIPDWVPFIGYAAGQVVVNGGTLYRANDTHTAAGSFHEDRGRWSALGGGNGGGVEVVDGFDSTSATAASSANSARILNGRIDKLQAAMATGIPNSAILDILNSLRP